MVIGALVLAVGLAAQPQVAKADSSITVRVVGTGRPMILIPGFLSSGDVWQSVVDHYKDRYECHVVTVAGFAGAPAATATNLKKIRDDVIAYAVAAKLNKPVLVGHSMGGMIALWIGASAPALPSAIVSVDGVPFLPALLNPAATSDSSRPQARQMRGLYASLTPPQLAAQTRLALGSMISDPAGIDRATKWAEASDPATAATLIEDLMTTDIRDQMPAVTAPVLLIPAVKALAADPAMMKNAEAAYERQVAAVKAHEIVPARTLHFVMLDDPEFLLETLDAFLARQAAGTK